jgi:threonine dehydratase
MIMPETRAQGLLPSIAEIQAAAELVYKFMQPTPQYRWALLCERLGAEVWVKHENYTPTGAFKARTAIVYVEKLLKREPGTLGLISATRGNHGQSVVLAAQRIGLPSVIVVPHGNSVEKNAAMRAQGAQLIEFGEDYQAAREEAARLAT